VGQQNQLIPVEDARTLVRQGGYLIDVRPPHQFARLHLAGAVNIPLAQIEEHSDKFRGEKAVFYCQAGIASQRAVQILQKSGCEEVYNLGSLKRAASEFGTESGE
jgi:rhodanese-related sulfurtransferase